VDAVSWLRYLSPFHYYAAHDPLGSGADLGDLGVLSAAALVLTAVAVAAFGGRDLPR
jgi:ABC-2 type transport system permease protein